MICGENHNYKNCPRTKEFCNNCKGDHVACSRKCPIIIAYMNRSSKKDNPKNDNTTTQINKHENPIRKNKTNNPSTTHNKPNHLELVIDQNNKMINLIVNLLTSLLSNDKNLNKETKSILNTIIEITRPHSFLTIAATSDQS